jgi:hypothetical protein
MRWLRLFFVLPLFASAILFVILATQNTDIKSAQTSLDRQKLMLIDLQKVGTYTEAYRRKQGVPPDHKTLDQWLQKQKFNRLNYTDGLGMPLSILPKGDKCADVDERTLSGNQQYSYFLCYQYKSFRFLYDDVFIPQTGASSLATSLKDYETPLGARLTFGFIALVLLTLAWVVGFWRNTGSTASVAGA